MKQILVLSGKGGTGKTSVVASFAALAERSLLVDCDVDAANLHLLVGVAEDLVTETFAAGFLPEIDGSLCTRCGPRYAV